jgi:general secretion pathway protein C
MRFAPMLSGFLHSLGEVRGRRQLSVALGLLALASALFWTLALRRHSSVLPPAPLTTAPAALAPALPDAAELARLLGQPGPLAGEAVNAPRFVLLGVVAGISGGGAALIAVDGAPPRPFGLGAELAPGFVIQRLVGRAVMLAGSMQGPVKLTLELPAWAPANRTTREAQATEQSRTPTDASPQTGPPAEGSTAPPGSAGAQVVP